LHQSDIDLVEINEAFAAVVLAWQIEIGAKPRRSTPMAERSLLVTH
jgi:acetyl-CoA acyltransferase